MPSVMCNAYSYACMTSYLFVMRDRFLPTFLDENSLIWINTSLAPLLHIFIMPSCISRVGEMRPEDGCVSRCWHHHHPHRPSMLMCASPKTIHFWKKKTELISSASKAVWIDVPVTGMLSLPRPMMMDACSHGANFQPTRSQHLGHIFSAQSSTFDPWILLSELGRKLVIESPSAATTSWATIKTSMSSCTETHNVATSETFDSVAASTLCVNEG